MLTGGPTQAKHWVIGSLLVTGSLAVVDDLYHGNHPSPKIALGLVVAGVVLSVMADFAPSIAIGFSALLLVSSVVNVGGRAFHDLAKGLNA